MRFPGFTRVVAGIASLAVAFGVLVATQPASATGEMDVWDDQGVASLDWSYESREPGQTGWRLEWRNGEGDDWHAKDYSLDHLTADLCVGHKGKAHTYRLSALIGTRVVVKELYEYEQGDRESESGDYCDNGDDSESTTVQIQYDSNGGLGAMDALVAKNVNKAKLDKNTFWREYYTFQGWNTKADGSGDSYTDQGWVYFNAESKPPTRLYAQWAQLYPLITYRGNGNDVGAPPPETLINVGSSQQVSSNTGGMGKTGYTFANSWSTKSDCTGTTYVLAKPYKFTKSITLFACWTPVRYHVVYHDDGKTTGTAPADVYFNYGGSTPIASNSGLLAKTGSHFGGWNTQTNGLGITYAVGSTYASAANLDVYPVWVPNAQVRVFYDANGGTGDLPATQSSTSADITILGLDGLSSPVTRTGYSYLGWNTLRDGTGRTVRAGDTYAYATGADLTLFAWWSLNNYTLSYNVNGGDGDAPTATSFTVRANPTVSDTTSTRAGYSFTGWAMNKDGSGTIFKPGDPFTTVADTTLYAVWTPKSYTVSYDTNGGSVSTKPGNQTFTYGNSVTLDDGTNLTRDGFTFQGWNTKDDKSGVNYVAGAPYSDASDLHLFAVWSPKDYTVSYQKNGGTGSITTSTTFTVISPTTVQSNTDLSGNPKLTRDGYTFVGWNTDSGGRGLDYKENDPYGSSHNLTLYAQWLAKKYTVTYYADRANAGQTAPAKQNFTVETPAVISNDSLIRTGYTQQGWMTQTDGFGTDYTAGSSYADSQNLDLHPRWVLTGHYSVNYDINGGTGTSPSTVDALGGTDSTISTDAGFTNPGHTFAGWNTAKNGSGSSYDAHDIYSGGGDGFSSLTLYAQWDAIDYTISYDLNGGTGTSPDDQTYTVDDPATIPILDTAPTREGYTFRGWWSDSPDGAGDVLVTGGDEYGIAGDITLFAVWTADNHTLRYSANGGSSSNPSGGDGVPHDQVFTVATPATVLAADDSLSRAGYTFLGRWNTARDGNGTSYSAGNRYGLARDETLYAQWHINTYRLTYDANGGDRDSLPAADSFTVEDGATVAGDATSMTRAGYTFIGWNTAKDGSLASYRAGDDLSGTADVTLYAQWRANVYTVTYRSNLGTGTEPGSTTFTVEAAATVSSVVGRFTRDGYVLKSWWNTESDGSGTSYRAADTISTPGDVTLYAVWQEESLNTVAYNANGATGDAPSSQIFSTTPPTLSDVGAMVNAGYTFMGWNTKQNGTGTHYDAGLTWNSRADLYLYAEWHANALTLSYNCGYSPCPTVGTGAVPATVGFTADKYPTVTTTIPTRAGYTFVRWDTHNDGNGYSFGSGSLFDIPESTTLYAQWTANRYDVVYNANGATGTTPDAESFAFGNTVTIPNEGDLNNNDGSFEGWNTERDGSGDWYQAGDHYGDAATITLYAVWHYAVAYDANGGATSIGMPASQSVWLNHSAEIQAGPNDLTKSGSEFKGWYNTDPGGHGDATYVAGDTYSELANLTLYALWVPEGSKVLLYDTNGGKGTAPDYVIVPDSDTSALVAAPRGSMYRTGYRFVGWGTSRSHATTVYQPGDYATVTSDVVLFAQWAPIEHLLTYNANAAGVIVPAAQKFSVVKSTKVSSSTPTRVGYAVSGWNTLPDGTGVDYHRGQTVSGTSDVKIYALWKKVKTPNSQPTPTYTPTPEPTPTVTPTPEPTKTAVAAPAPLPVPRETFGALGLAAGGVTALAVWWAFVARALPVGAAWWMIFVPWWRRRKDEDEAKRKRK
jgi:uncharacterized repeat protein (TIGR02543 family)